MHTFKGNNMACSAGNPLRINKNVAGLLTIIYKENYKSEVKKSSKAQENEFILIKKSA